MTQNLEATAYSRYIDSELFKEHLVPEQASNFADRFIETSSTILPPFLNEDILMALQQHITRIFAASLLLKASTILTRCRYQLQIRSPNSTEGELDNRPLLAEQNHDSSPYTARTIGRLNIYNTKFFNRLHRQANVLLDTNNFFLVHEAYPSNLVVHSKDVIIHSTSNLAMRRIANLENQTPTRSHDRDSFSLLTVLESRPQPPSRANTPVEPGTVTHLSANVSNKRGAHIKIEHSSLLVQELSLPTLFQLFESGFTQSANARPLARSATYTCVYITSSYMSPMPHGICEPLQSKQT